MYLAPSTPKATGREFKPKARSPSIDLKSLTIAIPKPAIEYRIGLENTHTRSHLFEVARKENKGNQTYVRYQNSPRTFKDVYGFIKYTN